MTLYEMVEAIYNKNESGSGTNDLTFIGAVSGSSNTLDVSSFGNISTDNIIIVPTYRAQCTGADYTSDSYDNFISPFVDIKDTVLTVYNLSQTHIRGGDRAITFTLALNGRIFNSKTKTFIGNVTNGSNTATVPTGSDPRDFYYDALSVVLSNTANAYVPATSNTYAISKSISNGVLTIDGLTGNYTTTRNGAFNFTTLSALVFVFS